MELDYCNYCNVELHNGNCYDCEPEKDRCRYCGTDIVPGDGVCDTCYEKELTR